MYRRIKNTPHNLILFIAGFISLAIITGLISYRSFYNKNIKTMTYQSRAIVNNLEGWLDVKANRVESNALLLRELDIGMDAVIHYFGLQTEIMEHVSIAFAGFPDGSLVFGGDWDIEEDFHVTSRPWYVAAMQSPGEVVFTRPYLSRTTGEIAIAAARTVNNYDDSSGIVALNVPFSTLVNHIRSENVGEGYTYFVIDYDGNILLHPDTILFPLDEIYFQNIKEIHNGRYAQTFENIQTYGFCSHGGTVYLGVPLGVADWYVIVGVPRAYIIRDTMPAIISLVAVIVFALGVSVSVWQMMHKVKQSAIKERYAHGLTQSFLDAAPFFVEMWDKDLNLIDCNKSVLSVFGLEKTEDFLNGFFRLSADVQPCDTPSKVKLYKTLEECFTKGRSTTEWVHLTLDGEPIPFDVTYVRLKRGDEDIAVGYSHDLRQIKLANEKVQVAELENQAKSRFLAQMSHEIRTPINAVLGIAEIELLKNTHSSDTEEAFQRIYNSSQMLISIINDILDLSQINADKMKIIPAAYEIASLIANTVQINLLYLGSKNIKFDLMLDENLPQTLNGDELRIRQVINNILSNAFKYTSEGTVTLRLGMEKMASGEDIILVICVSDTGQGMSHEQVNELFSTDYTRFNQEHNHNIQGTGLGLNIAHALTQRMGGEIKVESEPGRGSVFTILLPQKIENGNILGAETVKQLQSMEMTKNYLKKLSKHDFEPMPYGRVLIVDDVETNLYVAKGLLANYKLEIETASSGIEAVARIEKGQVYDIVFMDHMMPEMDGIEATRIIRDMGYIHPIIALTANALQGMAKTFLDSGFTDFIAKPVKPTKLDNCLIKYIRDKQSPEVLASTRKAVEVNRSKSVGQKSKNALTENIVKAFLMDAKKFVDTIVPIRELGVMDEDAYKAYTTQVHGMKSALANVQQLEMSELAGILEDAGLNHDIELINNRTHEFLDRLEDIISELSSKAADSIPREAEAKVNSPMDTAFVSEKFSALAIACETYDTQTTQDLLTELKAMPLSEYASLIIDEIETQLLISNDEEAANLAQTIVKKLR